MVEIEKTGKGSSSVEGGWSYSGRAVDGVGGIAPYIPLLLLAKLKPTGVVGVRGTFEDE